MNFDLSDLALHNIIEHDASLVHDNASPEAIYAPGGVNHALLEQLLCPKSTSISNYAPLTSGNSKHPYPKHLSLIDFVRARVRRERASGLDRLGDVHHYLALGEVALLFLVFSHPRENIKPDGYHISARCTAQFFGYEKLPTGWQSSREGHEKIKLIDCLRLLRSMSGEWNEIKKEVD